MEKSISLIMFGNKILVPDKLSYTYAKVDISDSDFYKSACLTFTKAIKAKYHL